MDNITMWINRISKAKLELEKTYKEDISEEKIFYILLVKYNVLENPLLIYEEKITKDEIIKAVKSFNLKNLVCGVELNIEDYKLFNYEEKVYAKAKNIRWIVHKSDSDPFPSNPHAHDYKNNVKLHLGNGNLYRKRKIVGSLRKKELLKIREIIYYKSTINLPPIEI